MIGHVDGNALAGPLSDIFAVDVTSASGRCAHCGSEHPLGRALVYSTPMGIVVRCCDCDGVLAVLVVRDDDAHLEIAGLTSLSVSPRSSA